MSLILTHASWSVTQRFINEGETNVAHKDLHHLFKPNHSQLWRELNKKNLIICYLLSDRCAQRFVFGFIIQVTSHGVAQHLPTQHFLSPCVSFSPTFSHSCSLCRRWWQFSSCCSGTGHWRLWGKGDALDRYGSRQGHLAWMLSTTINKPATFWWLFVSFPPPPECNFLLLSERTWWVHTQQHGSGLAGTGAKVTRAAWGGAAGGAEGAGIGSPPRHWAALLQGKDRDPQFGSESSVHSPHTRGLLRGTGSHTQAGATSFTNIIQPGYRGQDIPHPAVLQQPSIKAQSKRSVKPLSNTSPAISPPPCSQ